MRRRLLVILFLMFCGGTVFAQQTAGLFLETAASKDGYVLFAPTGSDSTYLVDKCGKRIHTWYANRKPGLSVYLLPDGSLLRTEAVMNVTFGGAGSAGGRIARYDWNSNLLWSYIISDTLQMQNHDVCPMPNGNVLVAVWEKLSASQAKAAGRNPAILGTEVWSAKLIELQPTGVNGATIVWQWRLWDHLVQDFDAAKPNYGVVADHPELVDLNYNAVGGPTNTDWIHLNAVSYNAELDQVMISAHSLSELYILDHGTTTGEAATHTGGTHGKGGDLLYRWGNPAAYKRGTVADRKLYLQHNPDWIPAGYPDAGKIMVFNNGVGRPGGNASSVDIIAPPLTASGGYSLVSGQAYGPASAVWSYQATVPTSFFSLSMGGAQRLQNGNTLICEGDNGHFFELDGAKTIVWDYVNPVNANGPVAQGATITGNLSYRSVYYPLGYSGFTGQTLTPGNPIEQNPLSYNCVMNTKEGIGSYASHDDLVKIANPFTTAINISSGNELRNLGLSLSTAAGRRVGTWNIATLPANEHLSLSLPVSLPAGIYFFTYYNGEVSGCGKLVKIE